MKRRIIDTSRSSDNSFESITKLENDVEEITKAIHEKRSPRKKLFTKYRTAKLADYRSSIIGRALKNVSQTNNNSDNYLTSSTPMPKSINNKNNDSPILLISPITKLHSNNSIINLSEDRTNENNISQYNKLKLQEELKTSIVNEQNNVNITQRKKSKSQQNRLNSSKSQNCNHNSETSIVNEQNNVNISRRSNSNLQRLNSSKSQSNNHNPETSIVNEQNNVNISRRNNSNLQRLNSSKSQNNNQNLKKSIVNEILPQPQLHDDVNIDEFMNEIDDLILGSFDCLLLIDGPSIPNRKPWRNSKSFRSPTRTSDSLERHPSLVAKLNKQLAVKSKNKKSFANKKSLAAKNTDHHTQTIDESIDNNNDNRCVEIFDSFPNRSDNDYDDDDDDDASDDQIDDLDSVKSFLSSRIISNDIHISLEQDFVHDIDHVQNVKKTNRKYSKKKNVDKVLQNQKYDEIIEDTNANSNELCIEIIENRVVNGELLYKSNNNNNDIIRKTRSPPLKKSKENKTNNNSIQHSENTNKINDSNINKTIAIVQTKVNKSKIKANTETTLVDNNKSINDKNNDPNYLSIKDKQQNNDLNGSNKKTEPTDMYENVVIKKNNINSTIRTSATKRLKDNNVEIINENDNISNSIKSFNVSVCRQNLLEKFDQIANNNNNNNNQKQLHETTQNATKRKRKTKQSYKVNRKTNNKTSSSTTEPSTSDQNTTDDVGQEIRRSSRQRNQAQFTNAMVVYTTSKRILKNCTSSETDQSYINNTKKSRSKKRKNNEKDLKINKNKKARNTIKKSIQLNPTNEFIKPATPPLLPRPPPPPLPTTIDTFDNDEGYSTENVSSQVQHNHLHFKSLLQKNHSSLDTIENNFKEIKKSSVSGFFKIPPKAKRLELSSNDYNLDLIIIHGRGEISLMGTTEKFKKFDTFLIDKNQTFYVTNLNTKDNIVVVYNKLNEQ